MKFESVHIAFSQLWSSRNLFSLLFFFMALFEGKKNDEMTEQAGKGRTNEEIEINWKQYVCRFSTKLHLQANKNK